MSKIRRQITVLLSDPRGARFLALGLALVALVGSLGAPDSVFACTPPGDGGIGGCSPF
jgi:hypothetical protein